MLVPRAQVLNYSAALELGVAQDLALVILSFRATRLQLFHQLLTCVPKVSTRQAMFVIFVRLATHATGTRQTN